MSLPIIIQQAIQSEKAILAQQSAHFWRSAKSQAKSFKKLNAGKRVHEISPAMAIVSKKYEPDLRYL